jgi:hypothetical protein
MTPRAGNVCAWCGRRERDGIWAAVAADEPEPAAASHAICPECYAKAIAELPAQPVDVQDGEIDERDYPRSRS